MKRLNGYAPIGDYAVLGDGRTVALVARDGRVDWFPVPTMHAPPLFAALLDTEVGGYLELCPNTDFTATRRYIEHTNVLETTYRTDSGTLRVIDALDVGTSGLLPWVELARRVECVSGEVPVKWAVVPGNRFGTAQPWVHRRGRVPLIASGDQLLAVLSFDIGDPVSEPSRVCGKRTMRAGETGLLTCIPADNGPLPIPERGQIEERIDATIDAWRKWSDQAEYDGLWRDAVLRSALVLKTLIYSPTGAIAAAATTSLPERIGGDKNYDYRYAWVRDSSFVLDALIELDLAEEVDMALSFLMRAIARSSPQLEVFYNLDGDGEHNEAEVPLAGYLNSRPVRSGNSAEDQLQLGNFGDLFEAAWFYVETGNLLDERTGTLLAALADEVCDQWREKDSGIWELPYTEHYTISKMACWVALDRAAQLAAAGHLPDAHADRWLAERDQIREWVDENCWSEEKRAYSQYAGTDRLDASVLRAACNGFTSPHSDRMTSTIQAIRDELGQGPLVYRYTGSSGEEGAFVACSFWLVSALARSGQVDEACSVMDATLGYANDLGLFSEQIDPESGGLLGNIPQALSHLALITAARDCSDARDDRSATSGTATRRTRRSAR